MPKSASSRDNVVYLETPEGGRVRAPEFRAAGGWSLQTARTDSALGGELEDIWNYMVRKRAWHDGEITITAGRRTLFLQVGKDQYFARLQHLAERLRYRSRKPIRRALDLCIHDGRAIVQAVFDDGSMNALIGPKMTSMTDHRQNPERYTKARCVGFLVTILNARYYSPSGLVCQTSNEHRQNPERDTTQKGRTVGQDASYRSSEEHDRQSRSFVDGRAADAASPPVDAQAGGDQVIREADDPGPAARQSTVEPDPGEPIREAGPETRGCTAEPEPAEPVRESEPEFRARPARQRPSQLARECVEIWNEICGEAGLPRVQWPINGARLRKLIARLREPLFRADPAERWRAYCQQIVRDVGPAPDWPSGRPNLEWALRPATPDKVHDGVYRKAGGGSGRPVRKTRENWDRWNPHT